jgi:hypothetical protein
MPSANEQLMKNLTRDSTFRVWPAPQETISVLGVHPARPAVRLRIRPSSSSQRLRVYAYARSGFLDAFDHDPLARFQPLVDDPQFTTRSATLTGRISALSGPTTAT